MLWTSLEYKHLEYYNKCRKRYKWSIYKTVKMAQTLFTNRSFESIRQKLNLIRKIK